MLADLLQNQEDWIVTYHQHDSLLENKPEDDLTEEERKAAWEEYEAEKKGLQPYAQAAGMCLLGISSCETFISGYG